MHETACDSCIVWAKSDRLVSRVKVHSPGQQVRGVETREGGWLGWLSGLAGLAGACCGGM